MERRRFLQLAALGVGAVAMTQISSTVIGKNVLPVEYVPDPNRVLLPHALSMDIGWPIHPQLGVPLWSKEMINRLYNNGIRWIRLIAFPEHTKGWTETALERMRGAVINFSDRGIRPVMLLTQGSFSAELARSDDYEKDFIDLVAKPLVRAFSDRIWWWQLINEPNHDPTYHHPKQYARLVEMWRVEFGNSAPLSTGSVLIHWGNWKDYSIKGAPGWLAAVLTEGKRLGWKEDSLPFARLSVQMYVDWFARTKPERLASFIQPTRNLIPISIPLSITEIGWVREDAKGESTVEGALIQADNIRAVIEMATKRDRLGEFIRESLNLDTVNFYCEADHFFEDKLSTWGMFFYPGYVPEYMPEQVRPSLMTPAMAMFQANAEAFKLK